MEKRAFFAITGKLIFSIGYESKADNEVSFNHVETQYHTDTVEKSVM